MQIFFGKAFRNYTVLIMDNLQVPQNKEARQGRSFLLLLNEQALLSWTWHNVDLLKTLSRARITDIYITFRINMTADPIQCFRTAEHSKR